MSRLEAGGQMYTLLFCGLHDIQVHKEEVFVLSIFFSAKESKRQPEQVLKSLFSLSFSS